MKSEAQSLGQLPPNSKDRNKDHFLDLTNLEPESCRDQILRGSLQQGSILHETVWIPGTGILKKVSVMGFF